MLQPNFRFLSPLERLCWRICRLPIIDHTLPAREYAERLWVRAHNRQVATRRIADLMGRGLYRKAAKVYQTTP